MEFRNEMPNSVTNPTSDPMERLPPESSTAATPPMSANGTLAMASALAGYVTTQKGSILAFSMMVNDYKGDVSDVAMAQDKLATVLARSDVSDQTAWVPRETHR